jgi:hypothetical protein
MQIKSVEGAGIKVHGRLSMSKVIPLDVNNDLPGIDNLSDFSKSKEVYSTKHGMQLARVSFLCHEKHQKNDQ